jgi:hypothetical protein
MRFHCIGVDGFQDAIAMFEKHPTFIKLTERQKDTVCNLLGEWFETAIDDVVYRMYEFPLNSGLEPSEYINKVRDDGLYIPMTYCYNVTYPDFCLYAQFEF